MIIIYYNIEVENKCSYQHKLKILGGTQMISGQTMFRKQPVTKYTISLKDIVSQIKLSFEKKENIIVSVIVPILSEEGFMFENEMGDVRSFKLSYQDKYEYAAEDGVKYVLYPKFPRLANGLIPTEAQIKHKYHKETVEYYSNISEVRSYNFYVAGR